LYSPTTLPQLQLLSKLANDPLNILIGTKNNIIHQLIDSLSRSINHACQVHLYRHYSSE